MARVSGLIIPVEYLDNALNGGTDEDGRETDAVTRATAFVNTYAVNYLEFDAYTENDAVEESSSDSMEDEQPTIYTINAPKIIEHICLQAAIAIYKLSLDEVYRNGEEREYWEARLKGYQEDLKTIDVEPEKFSKTISLNSYGCMLIARNQNIIPWTAYVISATTNVWNVGEHFEIRKGGRFDTSGSSAVEYIDGWYFDASVFISSMEGTLYYHRSYRKDTKDYMKLIKSEWNNN